MRYKTQRMCQIVVGCRERNDSGIYLNCEEGCLISTYNKNNGSFLF